MMAYLKRLISNILRFANYDFCPGANPFVYWLKSPIGWVTTAIGFSIAVGLFIGPQGFILAAAFTTLLVLGLVWPWISMKGIKCQLVLDDAELREGEETKIVVQVQNYWPIPVFGVMVNGDFLQELNVDEEPLAFSLRRVPAWSEAEFRIPITPRRRGHLPSNDILLSTGFPFGLTAISKPVDVANRRLVWPACQSLEGQPAANSSTRHALGSLCDRSGEDGDVIGVRDYRQGDRLRNVHWAQTVRSQRLMVRERQTLASSTVNLVVDLTPAYHTGHGSQSTFEWAIRIAASICWQLNRTGAGVQLSYIGLESQNQRDTSNHLGIKSLMDSLANLPTFSQAQQFAVEHRSDPQYVSFAGSSLGLFVGTSKSVANQRAELQGFVIDLAGFSSDEPLTFFDVDVADVKKTEQHSATDIEVTSPQEAAEQLETGWRRSFSNAAG